MKINEKIISIPPYISTDWRNIAALYVKESILILTLIDNTRIEIPDLSSETIQTIFTAHTESVEQMAKNMQHVDTVLPQIVPTPQPTLPLTGGNVLRFGVSLNDNITSVMQHNPEQAGLPEIPEEMLEKIAAITRIISPKNNELLPKPVQDCNCVYCQIARTIQKGMPEPSSGHEEIEAKAEEEETVSDSELSFQEWNIVQSGEYLFNVTNRLDPKESYVVFLGDPVGCNCGSPGCEHILAVLKS